MSGAVVIGLPRVNQVTGRIIAGAMKVHSQLGPGLLESAYEACLAHELRKDGLQVNRQAELPVIYDGETWSLATASICSLKTWLSLN